MEKITSTGVLEMITDLVEKQAAPIARAFSHVPSQLETWLDPEKFAHMQRIAQMFAASDLVPSHFKGNLANCAIALHMAYRMNIDPMMALQNMHIVHGNPGISAQLGIALANASGAFQGPITFVVTGEKDNLMVTAKARLVHGGADVSMTVSFKQAIEAGWPKTKDGGIKPFWRAMPEQMLRYRAATFLIRTYAPDVLLGMHTKEEWEDQGDGVEARSQPVAALAAMIESAPSQPQPQPQERTKRRTEKKEPQPQPQPEPQTPKSAADEPPATKTPTTETATQETDTWEF
jgi:hypothetical protein